MDYVQLLWLSPAQPMCMQVGGDGLFSEVLNGLVKVKTLSACITSGAQLNAHSLMCLMQPSGNLGCCLTPRISAHRCLGTLHGILAMSAACMPKQWPPPSCLVC